MDVEKVRFEMEKVYRKRSMRQLDDAEWWEKSSAQGWLRFLEVSRQFALPANFESLLFFRVTFSYDVIIHRLDRNLNLIKEYEGYTRERAKEARLRVKENWSKRWRGQNDMDYLQIEELGDALTLLFFQLQRNVETPIVHFRNIVGKIAYIVSLFLKLGYLIGLGFAGGSDHQLRVEAVVRPRDRLDAADRAADHLRLGSARSDRRRPGDHPQNPDPPEPARHQTER